jgi:hypothetical protein
MLLIAVTTRSFHTVCKNYEPATRHPRFAKGNYDQYVGKDATRSSVDSENGSERGLP